MTRELLEWFPCQKASTCHKNSRLGSIACSTQWCNKGAQFHGGRKSQQCQKYFFQYSTLACKRPQVWTQGHQACFLPRAPSNLVMPSWQHGSQSSPNPRTRVRLQLLFPIVSVTSLVNTMSHLKKVIFWRKHLSKQQMAFLKTSSVKLGLWRS